RARSWGYGHQLTYWTPASPFPVPHSSEPRPGSLEFPTEPVTREAHPLPPQVRARRTFLVRRPVQGRIVAVQGQYLQQSSFSSGRIVAVQGQYLQQSSSSSVVL
ncbi:hypothetical protein Taro_034270, partial [Colocasia esculenta]|nr:hypothetical protein [Colocasia esculenta]